jgi:tRNA G46 methylase TrmB
MKLPFKLPPQRNSSNIPVWNGDVFIVGKNFTPVLEYSEDLLGWTSSLTSLHEEVAGESHPIDIASRKDAIEQIKKLNLTKNSVILEIGCSSGFMLQELKDNFPHCVIIGSDVLKESLYKIAKTQKIYH